MHQEFIAPNTKRVLEALSNSGLTKDFYLAGGTALALYLGHRHSIDLDWFSDSFFCNSKFKEKLSKIGKLIINQMDEGILNGVLDGVKISFFDYPYPLISEKTKYQKNIYLAGKPDIAAMKLDAIATRGSGKDFIDLYFLLKEYSMEELLGFLRKKFRKIEYNETHLLKHLIYFDDVDTENMVKMTKEIDWNEVKDSLTATVTEHLNNSSANSDII
jgi:hypothetical protein